MNPLGALEGQDSPHGRHLGQGIVFGTPGGVWAAPLHRLILTSGVQEQCEKWLFPWFVVVVKRRKSGLLL